MIFYIHYILLTSGLCGTSVLLGVYLQSYSDASQAEIGFLLMTFPFVCLFVKPLFCSLADRYQAHKRYLVISMILMLIGYLPYLVVPFFSSFYEAHRRLCWWLFFWAGQMGNCALGVAWSLGDSLAVNYAYKHKAVYSRMRLLGTVSWGVYGYIIGLINELPFLPKYVPSFLTLYISVIFEIILILLWKDDDFLMVEPEELNREDSTSHGPIEYSTKPIPNDNGTDQAQFIGLLIPSQERFNLVDHQNPMIKLVEAEGVDKKLLEDANNKTHEDLNNNSFGIDTDATRNKNILLADLNITGNSKISAVLSDDQKNVSLLADTNQEPIRERSQSTINRNYIKLNEPSSSEGLQKKQDSEGKYVNYQLLLFKMIFKVDVRLVKYLIFFTLAGFILCPMSFLFISVSQECEKQEDCNFSRLAGYILICQASIETCCFLMVPLLQKYFGNLTSLVIGLTSMSLRYIFYSFGYYGTGVPVESAIIGECLHGVMFGIYCTLMADYALSFANQSRLFIPELREQGLLTVPNETNKRQVEYEEAEIKVALRATMQATFGGCMDGLGQGLGLLACGLIADHFNYVILWRFFLVVTVSTLIGYFIIEISDSKWSDRSRPTNKQVDTCSC